MFKDQAVNDRLNFSVGSGGKIARQYFNLARFDTPIGHRAHVEQQISIAAYCAHKNCDYIGCAGISSIEKIS